MPRPVSVRRVSVVLPTYEPRPPDPNPMFLENRVYQGASGRVYPLPAIDRIADRPQPRRWQAIYLENEYLQVMLLPELGGRIHRLLDKTNGYDAIYHQTVIKPALVGLAGPWCSGGIEFNWPQHHRPSTFLPTDVAIERDPDGSVTVWMGEHDPMARMRGMHGACLRPGRAVLEVRVRAYNRTADVQTFHWWANAATRVHEAYQSFFPPDTTHVADHARRATTSFPLSDGFYYGINYGQRAIAGMPAAELPPRYRPPTGRYAANDLSWYANIPVPTSYMAMGSREDFFGGYDHRAAAGLISIADHHIAPGKKQWTWGNHEFGYAWDRNLTDPDARGECAPYIELMTGVYTDNQPDFSFLQPGETKAWTQYWYPFRHIGPPVHANLEAACSITRGRDGLRLGFAVTAAHARARIRVSRNGRVLATWRRSLAPDRPASVMLPSKIAGVRGLEVELSTSDGKILLAHTLQSRRAGTVPPPATEPPAPADVRSADELFLIGQHLEQYRHATRVPEAYWREALRRDAGDSRCRVALGRWHLRRGELAEAATQLRAGLARATARNANPYDGEGYYQLGRCRQQQFLRALATTGSRDAACAILEAAYAAFAKAAWNHAWQGAAYHALAEIDAWRGENAKALHHADLALRLNADNLRARALRVIVLRRLGRTRDAGLELAAIFQIDPLDAWATFLAGKPLHRDQQVRLDVAHDCLRAGEFASALQVLGESGRVTVSRPDASLGAAPMVAYTRAWIGHLHARWTGRKADAEVRRDHVRARRLSPDWCFPARLEEIAVLEFARAANPRDARAALYLGNLFNDRRRHREAIACWQAAVRLEPRLAMAWRNLGIAHWNLDHDGTRARRAYERAVKVQPTSARYLHERDQLWKRLGVSPAVRWRALGRRRALLAQRDDLTLEYCALCNLLGHHAEAAALLARRRFQPWEGGEGVALGQHVRTQLALGRKALVGGQAEEAERRFRAALAVPPNLGEARHLLANCSDVHYELGCALAARGDTDAARRHWVEAAEFRGDFQGMSVRPFSEMTAYSALALRRLGREREAQRLLRALLAYARRLARQPARLDYFATSLPTMLLFDDDLQARQANHAEFLAAQALLGLGRRRAGRAALQRVLQHDPAHELAVDWLRSS